MVRVEEEIGTLLNCRKENCEVAERYPLIGLVGPVGSGKTTLAGLLQQNWKTPSYPISVHEEKFEENPYLKEWYKDPGLEGLSFKTQMYFLTSKVEQLGQLEGHLQESSQIIDPSVEMDYLFALAQREMGWMTPDEFNKYSSLFGDFRKEGKIATPDIFVVVNAEAEVIRERIEERGREFELSILTKYPKYIDTICGLVGSFQKLCLVDKAVIGIDSGKMDFVNTPQGKWAAVAEIGNWIGYYSRVRPDAINPEGTKIILPDFI